MSGEIRLPAGLAETIADKHDVAAADISALRTPDPPDGGIASAVLAQIMGALFEVADGIAFLNEAAAAQVRQVSVGLTDTDLSAGEAFQVPGLRDRP